MRKSVKSQISKIFLLLTKGILSIKNNGIKITYKKVLKKIFHSCAKDIGNEIFEKQQKETETLDIQSIISDFKNKPLISVIMPLYNSKVKWLKIAIQSLQSQLYANWELCAVDDGSKNTKAIKLVKKMAEHDSRIRISILKNNAGISAASNIALEMARGEYIALMDHDDELPYDAFFWIINEINAYPDTDFIYTDECKIANNRNKKFGFAFKPDWSPSLLLSFMYIMHLTVYKTALVKGIGGFRSEYDFSQDYDLALRMGEVSKNIRHIERVLYFWRAIKGSAASGGKNFARKTNMAALKDWYKRNGLDAVVLDDNNFNDPRPKLPDNLKVSIIIPSDNYDNITQCLNALEKNTAYNDYEVVVVANKNVAEKVLQANSGKENLKICCYDKPFNFSDKCNQGAMIATGNVLCFYNDDVYPLTKDWLERMLEILILPGVGAVNPIQLLNEQTILNAGITTGTPQLQMLAYVGMPYDEYKSVHLGPCNIRDISILSGACILIKKEIFNEINGFDAVNTPDSFSDTEFSLRLREKGYRLVCMPHAIMLHDNKLSWANFDKPDKAYFYIMNRWGKYLDKDPYITDSSKKYFGIVNSDIYKHHSPNNQTPRKPSGRDILFVCHDLSLTGAPLVLMDMVSVIMENDDWPVIYSLKDGPLREKYLQMGVTVIIDNSLHPDSNLILDGFENFAINFDLIIACTIVCCNVIKKLLNSLLPVLWWIHEGEVFIQKYKHIMPKTVGSNISVYTVSEYSKKKLDYFGFNYRPEELNYGIPYHNLPISRKEENTILFLTVGFFDYRKGYDILLNAIDYLDEKYLLASKFVLIGSCSDNNILTLLKKAAKKHDNIIHYENMDWKNILEWYNRTDCLILPSRDDPLPRVATEAMMYSTPVICSDETGIADYVINGENGFIFPSENYKALAEKIIYAIENKERMLEMGCKARKEIYEKYFTMEIFKRNVLKAINEVIKKNEYKGY